MNILIIEDNTFDSDLTHKHLLKNIEGCTVDVAGTIEAAKKRLTSTYDVALVDLKLPDGLGTDLILDLRETNKHMVIIMLTGSGDEEIVFTALKAGADEYITKKSNYLDELPGIILQKRNEKRKSDLQEQNAINVLYIEYHTADIDLTLIHFKRYAPQFKFHIAGSAEEALKLIPVKYEDQPRFQLILMDYKLPGINGIELTHIIRRKLKCDIPIIIVTGQGNEDVAIQALKLGVDEYLVKRENYINRLPSLLTSAYQKSLLKKQNIELAENEELFRRLFEEHSATKLIINPENGNIVAANKAASKYYGWSVEELTNMKIFDINTLPVSEVRSKMDITRTNIETQFEFKHRHADATKTDVKVFSSKIVLKGREFLHSIIYDISQIKKAEKQLKLLSTSIEQSPVSVVIADINGIVEYVNPKFTEVSGYTFEEVVEKNIDILNSDEHKSEFYKQIRNEISTGNSWQGEICNKKKTGELFWEYTIISPVKNENGEIEHFVGVNEDITEKKKMIDELIEAKDKAQESDRLKSAFLASMSHEIRTPLNAIVGFSGFIAENNENPELMDYSAIIRTENELLLKLIDDIIDFSLIESGKITTSNIDFDFNQLIDDLDYIFKEKGTEDVQLIKNKTLSTISVNSDRNRINQIFTNLISNALKFTEKGSITYGYELDEKNEIVCFVRDTGIGITATKQQDIFERFIKLDTFTQGTGLGLAIVKNFVQAMGGEIWVESEPGIGSNFMFKIPFTHESSSVKSIDSEIIDFPSYKKFTILIAEDIESNYLYLKTILQSHKIKVLHASNGEEAIKMCDNHKEIDLVLMDIKMLTRCRMR